MIKFSKLFVPILVIVIIWTVKLLELTFGWKLYLLGVYPRDWNTIWHIFTAPFIHGGFDHLYFNTLYWFVFSVALFYLYPRRAFLYLSSAFFDTYFLLWIIGRPAYHIGLSGVIYALASFIFFSTLFARDHKKMAITLIMIFLFSGMMAGFFPKDIHVSWEGHLSGAIVGFLLALIEKNISWQEEVVNRRKIYKDYT